MSDTDLNTACADLEREYPGYVFRANVRHEGGAVAFRFVAAIDGCMTKKPTGWCPTVKGACDEMRYILQEVRT